MQQREQLLHGRAEGSDRGAVWARAVRHWCESSDSGAGGGREQGAASAGKLGVDRYR